MRKYMVEEKAKVLSAGLGRDSLQLCKPLVAGVRADGFSAPVRAWSIQFGK